MDTEKCAALLCAVETGSLSAAAVRLGYTVSGMSRLVLSLESELGFKLLRRSRAGVEPTPRVRAAAAGACAPWRGWARA